MFVAACSQNSKTSADMEETSDAIKKKGKPVIDSISKATFTEWTQRWDAKGKAYLDTSALDYFRMPIIDFKEFLGEKPSGSRLYIGLDSVGKEYIPHIMLVSTGAKGEPRLDMPDHIWDVTRVCPPDCGEEQ